MSEETSTPSPHIRAPGLEVVNMTKTFGSLVALDNVSMKLRPGTFHALLGGNGASKSPLVKCIMGYYQPDSGQTVLGEQEVQIKNPREARQHGIGMVYQHFTLVPNMTVAENLVLSRGDVSMVIDWDKEYADLRKFMKTTPFFILITRKVSSLSGASGRNQYTVPFPAYDVTSKSPALSKTSAAGSAPPFELINCKVATGVRPAGANSLTVPALASLATNRSP